MSLDRHKGENRPKIFPKMQKKIPKTSLGGLFCNIWDICFVWDGIRVNIVFLRAIKPI